MGIFLGCRCWCPWQRPYVDMCKRRNISGKQLRHRVAWSLSNLVVGKKKVKLEKP
jgi:hypothetical protein